MSRRLDIVLFGATGVTGKHCIPIIVKFSKIKNHNLTWGIAGRSEKKLRAVLNSYEEQTGYSLKDITIIIADVQDKESLHSMARQARIVLNCCGPFRFFGEAVVEACIQERTHHVDVSGEIQYMEEMQLKYHKQAEEQGVYIISACAFESVPADLGVAFLQEKFTGTLHSVEIYVSYWEEGASKGPAVNYGTWESALNILAHSKELVSIRKQLFTKPLPALKPKLQMKLIPRWSDLVQSWTFPVHATDLPVVKRSQRLFYENESKRPIQIETYFNVKSFLMLIVVIIGGLVLLALTKFSAGLKLLLKYPETFTLGFISRQPLNEERGKNGRFSMTLCGKGWKEESSSPDYQFPGPPDRTMIATVSGPNPESDKMPSKGGVYPPGYAFAKTSLLEELDDNGVKFQVLYEEESE